MIIVDVLYFLDRLLGSGVKAQVSTALGITETRLLLTLALKTVFSLPVCETQIQWLQSASDICSNLLVITALASAKPNKL